MLKSHLRASWPALSLPNTSRSQNFTKTTDNFDSKLRDIVTAHNKEKALLEQKLEFSQLELKEVKDSFEEYKKMTDKMITQLSDSQNSEEADKHWGQAKHMYMREIVEIKQAHETEVLKLDLIIGKLNFK